MGREQKKGRAGNAKAYITRAKALKKLQLSLPEWRRLCIIKGVYPRDPKKKTEGADKTYYLRKDVEFLAHERLIDTIRAQATHRRKVTKAKSKKQLDVLRALVLKKPRTNLEHIVAERFPQFGDALRELDDPLCVISLFATLPAAARLGISAHRVANCKRLMNEFLNYAARTHALRRVFVSIKGYYYQVEVDGELITWVAPHRFTQGLPSDVDYSVMLTFLELYECMMNFVNFRLYTRENLAYPPRIDSDKDASGRELAAVVLKPRESSADVPEDADMVKRSQISSATIDEALAKATAGNAGDESDEDEEGAEDAEEDANSPWETEGDATAGSADSQDDDPQKAGKVDRDGEDARMESSGSSGSLQEEADEADDSPSRTLLFAGKSVVLGREVPVLELEFVLKSVGASKILHQEDVEQNQQLLGEVSYWIIDRPGVTGQRVLSIEYVQPQFVFDSVNAGVLLPPALYAPGARLPPHLSPFVGDEEDGGYRPWFKDVIERLKTGDTTVMTEAAVTAYLKSSDRKGGAQPSGKSPGRKTSSKTEGPVEADPKTSNAVDISVGSAAGSADATKLSGDVEPASLISEASEDAPGSGVEDASSSEEEDSEKESGEESGGEDAEESAEVQAAREKDLKLMMLSRKKSKQYNKFAKEEKLNMQRKAKLTEKRNRTDGRENARGSSKKHRRS